MPTSTIKCGTIIVALVPGGRGGGIRRFYMVASPTAENRPGETLWCLGISKQVEDPPPAHAFLLPFNPDLQVKVMTGLRKRSAVLTDWVVGIAPEQICNASIGYVPGPLLNKILAALKDRHPQQPN